jgi:plasmid stability protein
MGQVIVRQLDDEVIEEHRRQARARGVSLEQQLRDALSDAAQPSRAEVLARADALRARTKPGRFPSAAELVREDRDSR